jgi:long-chain fatty acid transport protein
MKKISLRATAVAVAALVASQAWATNGMLMEGYGPIALSMGGAAQAYDNGTAGMMNNVATLQLGENGTRADVALGVLGPNVTAMGDKSGGTSYIMPAVGWTRKTDQMTFGVGLMGQGGMGTEYGSTSPLAMGAGSDVRSELSVGRVIFPFSYQATPDITLGASLDYSWAGMDMKMAATSQDLLGMYAAGNGWDTTTAQNNFGVMVGQINGMVSNQLGNPDYARLDFSNSSDFTGAAKSTGFTGKLGVTYKATRDLTLGASYQLKTNLGDMKTGANAARFTLINSSASYSFPIDGKLVIRDFQMPAVLAAGLTFQANPKLMLSADVKSIDWSAVMSSFNMTFESAMGDMKFSMPQNWKDQTVVSLGGAYQMNDALVLRAGYSHSTNPVPDATVHPLFPAIVKDHYTAGFGYQIDKNMSVNAAVSHAPKVTVAAGQLGGQPITHSQTNYQLMLSYRY